MNRTGADKIQLVGLTAQASHGIYDFERTNKQTFIVDVTAFLDTRRAGLSDQLEDTLNYGQLASETIQVLTGTSVSLIETVAEMIAEQAFTHDIVQGVEVTVHKPQAPIQHHFQDVSVTIYRTRQDVAGGSWPTGEAGSEQQAGLVGARGSRAGRDSSSSAGGAGIAMPGLDAMAANTRAPHLGANNSKMPGNFGNSGAAKPGNLANSGKPVMSRTARANNAEANGQSASRVVLGLGGNLGRDQQENQQNLTNAVQKLIEIDGFEIRDVSPLVQTLPVLAPEQEEQGDYYNAVIIGETTLEPEELLKKTQAVEESFGRDRSQRWGPRPVDIDLVDVDHQECRTESLTLPHPLAYQRAFVLFPWSLIAPDDTLNGQPIREWLKIAPDRDGVVNVWDNWLIEPDLSDSAESADAVGTDAGMDSGQASAESMGSGYENGLEQAAPDSWGANFAGGSGVGADANFAGSAGANFGAHPNGNPNGNNPNVGSNGNPTNRAGRFAANGSGSGNNVQNGEFAAEQFALSEPPGLEREQMQQMSVLRQRPRLQRDIAVRPTPAGQVSISDANSDMFAAMDSFEDDILAGFTDSGATNAPLAMSAASTGGSARSFNQGQMSSAGSNGAFSSNGQFSRREEQYSTASFDRAPARGAGPVRLTPEGNWPEVQQNAVSAANDYQRGAGSGVGANAGGGGEAARNGERRSIRQRGEQKASQKTAVQPGESSEWTNSFVQNVKNNQQKTSRVYKAPPFGSIFEPQVD